VNSISGLLQILVPNSPLSLYSVLFDTITKAPVYSKHIYKSVPVPPGKKKRPKFTLQQGQNPYTTPAGTVVSKAKFDNAYKQTNNEVSLFNVYSLK
jgi:hypothetical protein